MGICWSDPPRHPPKPVVSLPLGACVSCGALSEKPLGDAYCEPCLQKNGFMSQHPLPPIVSYPLRTCVSCGAWNQKALGDAYCEPCLQKNGFASQHAYLVAYTHPLQSAYYETRPLQQQQTRTGTAMLTGFALGTVIEDMLDPTN